MTREGEEEITRDERDLAKDRHDERKKDTGRGGERDRESDR